MASKILQQSLKNPKELYKFLLRSCDKLPKGPKEHYKHSIKQVRKLIIYKYI